MQNESNFPVKVHPLPLSPGAATPSPSALTPQPIAESESLWMNSQWQKGRLIGAVHLEVFIWPPTGIYV